jgi:serine/threonine protein kinase
MSYTISKLLKQNELGKVYLATREKDIKEYVFKILYLKERYSQDEMEYILNSVQEILKLLSKVKGIVLYKTSTLNKENLILCSEFFKSLSLDQFLKRKKVKDEQNLWLIIVQIIETLYLLARSQFYLVNIKNENIFINEKLETRINYLTFSKILHLEDYLTNQDSDYKSCVFNLGFIILDLAKNLTGQLDYENSEISIELKSLITLCINKDTQARPSIFDIYHNDFIQERMKGEDTPREVNGFGKTTMDINNKFFGYSNNNLGNDSSNKYTFYNSIHLNK